MATNAADPAERYGVERRAEAMGYESMSEQPDSIQNYNPETPHYDLGDLVLGTDGNLWRLTCIDGHGYWQRMPVLNVETMQLESE